MPWIPPSRAFRLRLAQALPLLSLALLLTGSGCSSVATQIGQINNQLGTISTQFTTAINNQQAVIAAQNQTIGQIQTTAQTIQANRAKADTVLQKDTTAVVDLLKQIPTDGLVPRAATALSGALAYASAAQTEAGGVYTGPDRVDAQSIATGATTLPTVQANVGVDLATYTKVNNDLATAQAQMNALQSQLAQSSSALTNTNRELQGANGQLGELRRHLTLERIWAYLKTPMGILLMIALLIAFPALIPILGSLIGRLVGTFPALMSFFGVVHKDAVANIATGVGNFKDDLDKLGPDAQIAVSKVKEMLGTELKTATDSIDRRVIDHVRSTMNVS